MCSACCRGRAACRATCRSRGPKALIVPSPRLPTSSAPPNLPKLSGASARPHGAFSGAARSDSTQQPAVRIEHVDEAEARALHFFLAARVLLRIRHVEVAVDRLDAERREAPGRADRGNAPGTVDVLERAVEHIDATLAGSSRRRADASCRCRSARAGVNGFIRVVGSFGTNTACVASTFGAQPARLPCSVAKMKRAGPDTPPLVTTKSAPPENTMPVGLPGVPSGPGPRRPAASAAAKVGRCRRTASKRCRRRRSPTRSRAD